MQHLTQTNGQFKVVAVAGSLTDLERLSERAARRIAAQYALPVPTAAVVAELAGIGVAVTP